MGGATAPLPEVRLILAGFGQYAKDYGISTVSTT